MRKIFRILLVLFLAALLVLPACASERQAPQIRIAVMETDRKNGSAAVEESHKWFIRCIFPDRPDGIRYTILQTLSPSLTYEPGSLEISLLSGETVECRLRMEEHYLLTSGSVFAEEGTADRICISLTEAGNALIFPGAELRITYSAALNQAAPMGTQVLGTAQLNCLDAEGNRRVFLSDKAAVSTGGFHIRLTDAFGEAVAGGKFMVARAAEEQEKAAVIETLDTGDAIQSVVYVPFRDESGEKTYLAETDREGKAVCMGLAYGEYYLVQTELPEGNGLPSLPVTVTVNEVSHLTYEDGWKRMDGTVADQTVRIVTGSIVMPETGGPGTTAYTVSGILVIVSACLLLWFNRKPKITVS